ncbi:hypothetical protein OGAPHI_001876 [Ogataea philodendri]|uniref:Uncharacterized protein n=1 Tax=Ogataea philodendri TaxID=1378263 RepID=A0A9P8PA64_9ASCO|nr:uncharacterized protein OGAPHI_001876 [Ogataea philodendri]KAH3668122.1 hypothetical protein OGAPHI_001876 [Ogataea philodendri]
MARLPADEYRYEIIPTEIVVHVVAGDSQSLQTLVKSEVLRVVCESSVIEVVFLEHKRDNQQQDATCDGSRPSDPAEVGVSGNQVGSKWTQVCSKSSGQDVDCHHGTQLVSKENAAQTELDLGLGCSLGKPNKDLRSKCVACVLYFGIPD